jgi:hypothetical protein
VDGAREGFGSGVTAGSRVALGVDLGSRVEGGAEVGSLGQLGSRVRLGGSVNHAVGHQAGKVSQ